MPSSILTLTVWVLLMLLTACNSAVENIDTPQEKSTQQQNPNLVALYTFSEGTGATIFDVSGVEPALNLRIADASAIHWLAKGLSIDSPTEIRSFATADKINTAIANANALSIEAWIKPANTTQNGPSRIVSVSTNHSERNFMLAQEKNRYVVRLNTTTNTTNGTPGFETPLNTLTTELTHVVFTWDVASQTATIYINGQMVSQSGKIFTGDLSFQPHELILGNEVNIDDGTVRYWLGEIYLVAIYDLALSSQEVTQNYSAGL